MQHSALVQGSPAQSPPPLLVPPPKKNEEVNWFEVAIACEVAALSSVRSNEDKAELHVAALPLPSPSAHVKASTAPSMTKKRGSLENICFSAKKKKKKNKQGEREKDEKSMKRIYVSVVFMGNTKSRVRCG